eukprot:m.196226 g.196226  ORF g.196226 m.196226 type:complete len:97 (+) comp16813_c1_seq4:464-754(+)
MCMVKSSLQAAMPPPSHGSKCGSAVLMTFTWRDAPGRIQNCVTTLLKNQEDEQEQDEQQEEDKQKEPKEEQTRHNVSPHLHRQQQHQGSRPLDTNH